MDSPASRLQKLMDEDDLNQVELAERIDRSKGLVSSYLKEDAVPSAIFLTRVEDKLGWSGRWIRTGEGPERIVKRVKTTTHEYSNGEASVLRVVNEPDVRVIGVNDLDLYQPVKFIRYSVWASFVDNFDEFDFNNISDTYPVYLPGIDGPISEDHYVFEILGDSMKPTIIERSKVLAELLDEGNIEYMNAGVYIVAYRNYLVLKRIIDNNLLVDGTLTLHSDNPISGKSLIRRDDIRYVWQVTDIVGSKVR